MNLESNGDSLHHGFLIRRRIHLSRFRSEPELRHFGFSDGGMTLDLLGLGVTSVVAVKTLAIHRTEAQIIARAQ